MQPRKLFTCLLLIAGIASGQATFTGKVLDPAGNPVTGALVRFEKDGASTAVQSAAGGTFTSASLTPGSYTVIAEATGFSQAVLPNQALSAPSTSVLLVLGPNGAKTGGHFSGHVKGSNGEAVPDAVVTFTSMAKVAAPPTTKVITSGGADAGSFDSGSLPAGDYTIEIGKPGYPTSAKITQTLSDGGRKQLELAFCTTGCEQDCSGCGVNNDHYVAAILLVVFYIIAIIWVRAVKVALPGRRLLVARVADLMDRIEASGLKPTLAKRIAELERAGLVKADGSRVRQVLDRLSESVFWSMGLENAAYKTIHFCELALLDHLDANTVVARLMTAKDRIAKVEDPVAKALSDRIANALSATTPVDAGQLHALLVEAEYFLYDVGDSEFSEFTSWLNKAVWLTVVGIVLALALAVVGGHYILLVLGATGGFLSRLAQQLRRAKVPTDYGASWSMLFLSPVLGALSGWTGVLLIQLATGEHLQLLGAAFQVVKWNDPCKPETLAAAFLLGFSERLFDTIVKKLEDSIDQKTEDAKKQSGGPGGSGAPTPDMPSASFSPSPVKLGELLTVTIEKLAASAVSSLILTPVAEGTKTTIPHEGAAVDKTLQFRVPATLVAGDYSVSLTSSSGTIQVRGLLKVQA